MKRKHTCQSVVFTMDKEFNMDKLVEQIPADGKISPEEYAALFKAELRRQKKHGEQIQ